MGSCSNVDRTFIFQANVHALPGGNIDDADSCREWINVFNHDLSLPSFKLPSNLPIYKSFNKGTYYKQFCLHCRSYLFIALLLVWSGRLPCHRAWPLSVEL